VRGQVGGELQIAALTELGLVWGVESDAVGLLLHASRPGAELRVRVRVEAGGVWRWEIERGRLDLAELWPVLRERLGKEASGWSASGRVDLAGEGTWSTETGLEGELRLALREGWARSEELDAELGGVELDLLTQDFSGGVLAQGQVLRVEKISVGNLDVAEVSSKFGLTGDGVLSVTRLEAAMLGGRVWVWPVSVSLKDMGVDATAEVEGVSVAELARLTPEAVAGGAGALDGRVRVNWSLEAGLKFVEGGLEVSSGEAATLRLAPLPGFLTDQLPPILTWLSPGLAKDLRRIELGEGEIEVSSLDLDFSPDGPDGSRTAQVRMIGRPMGKSAVRSLRFEVNLSGDLTRVLMLGLSDKVTVEF
jgi:hypothetical protein